MSESEQQRRDRERQEDLAKLRGLRPIDDDFMRCIFRDNEPLAQLVLRIVLQKDDLIVEDVETQADLHGLIGARSIALDVLATDSDKKKYDIEIQRSDRGASKRRARYHSSAMDVDNLKKAYEFESLPESYVIFITENDQYGDEKPFHRIERVDLDSDGNQLFNDGEHILYVNGAYRGDSDIGKLMHDFSCWNPDDMNYDLLREATRFYKENPKGVEIVCKAFEDTRDKAREQTLLDSIKALMDNLKLSAKQAMEALNIPLSEQEKFASKL